MSIIIGLTGPTGSGKSSASKIAANLGVKIVDCDILARKAVEKESAGLKALTLAFGEDILNADKTLDRKALAKKAFKCEKNTRLLNKTILPFVAELVKEEILGFNKVLLDAPTLFESGIDEICDKTVAVLADRDIRLKRIISRDKMTEEDAKLRIFAGKDDEFYSKADFTVYNNEDTAKFENEVSVLFKKLFGGNING